MEGESLKWIGFKVAHTNNFQLFDKINFEVTGVAFSQKNQVCKLNNSHVHFLHIQKSGFQKIDLLF